MRIIGTQEIFFTFILVYTYSVFYYAALLICYVQRPNRMWRSTPMRMSNPSDNSGTLVNFKITGQFKEVLPSRFLVRSGFSRCQPAASIDFLEDIPLYLYGVLYPALVPVARGGWWQWLAVGTLAQVWRHEFHKEGPVDSTTSALSRSTRRGADFLSWFSGCQVAGRAASRSRPPGSP